MTIAQKIASKSTVFRRAMLALASISSVLILSACDNSGGVEGVLSSITSDITDAATPATPAAIASANPGAATARPAPAAAPAAPAVRAGDAGTLDGQMRADMQRLADNVNRHKAEFQRIRGALSADASSYFTLIGAINSRLQLGTTPANPELVAQHGQARTLLDRMNGDVAGLNSLSAQVANDAAFASYVSQEIKSAYTVPGVDRRQLDSLQAMTTTDVGTVQQLSQAIANDVTRQSRYLANERRNLATLDLAIRNGELYGQGAAPPAAAPPSTMAATPSSAVPAATPAAGQRRPLVTIRFDRPDVPFEQALYTAVSRALDRRPNAMFYLVAVSPNAGSAGQVSINADRAKRNAENVMRSLARMGLPANRLALSAITSSTVRDSQVQIFVR